MKVVLQKMNECTFSFMYVYFALKSKCLIGKYKLYTSYCVATTSFVLPDGKGIHIVLKKNHHIRLHILLLLSACWRFWETFLKHLKYFESSHHSPCDSSTGHDDDTDEAWEPQSSRGPHENVEEGVHAVSLAAPTLGSGKSVLIQHDPGHHGS
jgi:hypothetical protein